MPSGQLPRHILAASSKVHQPLLPRGQRSHCQQGWDRTGRGPGSPVRVTCYLPLREAIPLLWNILSSCDSGWTTHPFLTLGLANQRTCPQEL